MNGTFIGNLWERAKGLWTAAKETVKAVPAKLRAAKDKLVLVVRDKIEKGMRGTSSEELLARATADPVGVGVGRGPVFGLVGNIAIIRPNVEDPQQVEEILKIVMNLDDPSARAGYGIFKKFFPSFLLASTGEPAREMRKHFVKHMSPVQFYAQTQTQLRKLRVQKTAAPFSETVLLTEMALFAKTVIAKELFGVESLTLETQKIFKKIDEITQNEKFALMPWQFHFDRSAKEARKEYQQWIRETFKNLSALVQEEGTLLSEHFADGQHRVAMDAYVHGLPGIFVAANTLEKALDQGIRRALGNDALAMALKKEIDDHKDEISQATLLSKDAMPVLERFYLEVLRATSPAGRILRYTRKGIYNSALGLAIPPRTTIIFDIQHTLSSQKYFPDPSFYYGEGHSKNRPQSDAAYAALNHGALIPFGVGKRMCPGFKLAEVIFKQCIVELVGHWQLFGRAGRVAWLPREVSNLMPRVAEGFEYQYQREEKYYTYRCGPPAPLSPAHYQFELTLGCEHMDITDAKEESMLENLQGLKAQIYMTMRFIFEILKDSKFKFPEIHVIDVDTQYERFGTAVERWKKTVAITAKKQTFSARELPEMRDLFCGQIIIPLPYFDRGDVDTLKHFLAVCQTITKKLAEKGITAVNKNRYVGDRRPGERWDCYFSWTSSAKDPELEARLIESRELWRDELRDKDIKVYSQTYLPRIELFPPVREVQEKAEDKSDDNPCTPKKYSQTGPVVETAVHAMAVSPAPVIAPAPESMETPAKQLSNAV